MKKGLLIAGGVVLALAILIVVVPFLIPAGQYRTTLEKAATESMGRDVKINGGIRFSVIPTLGLNAKQVTVANLPGGQANLFASVDDLDVGVKLGSLFGGDLEISKLVLKKPTLWLEADVGGKPNWVFEPKPEDAAKTDAQRAKELEKLGFGDLRIVDGIASYRDKPGKVQQIGAVNAEIELRKINDPFKLTSAFVYNGDAVKLTLDAPSPRAFVEKQQTLVNVVLESEKLQARFNGAVDPTTMGVAGKLDAKGPSLRKLAAWTGSPIGEGGGFEQFAVVGDLKTLGPRTELGNATLAIDAARGRGNVIITTKEGAPPYVAANVILEALDVNPYLAPPATVAQGSAKPAEGVNVQQGWSASRIDLSGLKAVDGNLVIKTGQLTFQKMKIDRADLEVALRGGYMRTTMKSLALYGGSGAGVLVLDARQEALRVENTLSVASIEAKPFLKDAIGLDKIEGKANIVVSFAGSGLSQQSIMNTLAGKADFKFEDGALVGVNLAQVARQVQSALTGQAVGPAAKTDFAEMAASFAINKGVAHTGDLRLLNPFVRITGVGDINLAMQTVDMKITPKAVKTIQGQGGAQDIGGIGVPFNVKGPWAKPTYAPDLVGALQENFGRQIDDLSKSVNEGLSGLFGQKPKPKTP